jgi:hypothetical protein
VMSVAADSGAAKTNRLARRADTRTIGLLTPVNRRQG